MTPASASSATSRGRLIDRELELPRHRADLVPDAGAVRDEERLDEVVRPDRRLSHQVAHRLAPAQPPRAAKLRHRRAIEAVPLHPHQSPLLPIAPRPAPAAVDRDAPDVSPAVDLLRQSRAAASAIASTPASLAVATTANPASFAASAVTGPAHTAGTFTRRRHPPPRASMKPRTPDGDENVIRSMSPRRTCSRAPRSISASGNVSIRRRRRRRPYRRPAGGRQRHPAQWPTAGTAPAPWVAQSRPKPRQALPPSTSRQRGARRIPLLRRRRGRAPDGGNADVRKPAVPMRRDPSRRSTQTSTALALVKTSQSNAPRSASCSPASSAGGVRDRFDANGRQQDRRGPSLAQRGGQRPCLPTGSGHHHSRPCQVGSSTAPHSTSRAACRDRPRLAAARRCRRRGRVHPLRQESRSRGRFGRRLRPRASPSSESRRESGPHTPQPAASIRRRWRRGTHVQHRPARRPPDHRCARAWTRRHCLAWPESQARPERAMA